MKFLVIQTRNFILIVIIIFIVIIIIFLIKILNEFLNEINSIILYNDYHLFLIFINFP